MPSAWSFPQTDLEGKYSIFPFSADQPFVQFLAWINVQSFDWTFVQVDTWTNVLPVNWTFVQVQSGIFDQTELEKRALDVAPDDLLVLYADGANRSNEHRTPAIRRKVAAKGRNRQSQGLRPSRYWKLW